MLALSALTIRSGTPTRPIPAWPRRPSKLGPATIRPDADQAEITERMPRRGVAHLIVSNPTASCSASSRPNRVKGATGITVVQASRCQAPTPSCVADDGCRRRRRHHRTWIHGGRQLEELLE
jgi:hypothetical protein